jgi:hypothetical protein
VAVALITELEIVLNTELEAALECRG